MRKGREITGLPVVSLATGEELGFVEDLVWDHRGRRVTHIVINQKKINGKQSLVSFADVQSFGEDAVTVAEEALPDNAAAATENKTSRLAGVPVLTAEGNSLGTLEDLIFTNTEGELLGYEISSGLVGDLVSGRNVLPLDAILTWGEDAVIVSDDLGQRRESDAVSDLPE